jgi:hypothetical protein
VKLALGTTEAGKTAQAAAMPLLGLGDSVEKVGKKSEWTAEQLKKIHEQTALFDKAAESVELFYATVAQDVILQNAKVKVAEFALPFKDLETTVVDKTSKIRALMGGVTQSYDMFGKSGEQMAKQHVSAFSSMFDGIKGATDSLIKGMTGNNGFSGLMSKLGSDIVAGFGSILSGGLTTVINLGVQLAFEGVKKIGGMIAGLFKSEESKHVNQPRDQFFSQFGGYEGLASQLTDTLIGQGVGEAGDVASGLIRTLYDADTKDKFAAAQAAIANVFASSGQNVAQFRFGSNGLQDFGSGTRAILHGREEVRTEAQVLAGDAASSALLSEFKAMRRELQLLPLHLTTAVQQGMA